MSAVQLRDKALNEALINFEKANGADKGSYAFVAGFYSALIRDLAVDRITDYTYVMEMLRRNTK